MQLPGEFFTAASVFTLAGAAGATLVVCNTLQAVFNFNPRWLALAIAEALALGGVYASGGSGAAAYLVGVVNGCLIYSTAAGGASITGLRPGGGDAVRAAGTPAIHPTPVRKFRSPWY